MKRLRIALVTALAASCLWVAAAPGVAGPCQEDPCPPCYTEKVDALWQKYTGQGPLFMCPK